ncbi:MAG: hypothetical protein WEB93_01040, partial [Sphingomonadales bacterium]
KIYPFTLTGGLTHLVERYATAYHGGDEEKAATEIAEVNPHVLLALGHVEMEADQEALLTGTTAFEWKEFQKVTAVLPFSRRSDNTYKTFDGEAIFTDQELAEIEMRSYVSFQWMTGLTGITNTLVYQMGALPSVMQIINRNNREEYKLMTAQNRDIIMSAATHDNLIALYQLARDGDITLTANLQNGSSVDVNARLAKIKFGISDRYPDFIVAARLPADEDDPESRRDVDQSNMLHFNYSMLGTANPNKGYQAEKVRSVSALRERIAELDYLTGTQVVYATTDLVTDLRLAFMDLLGTHGLPDDLTHRPSGVLKERVANNPAVFCAPPWVTRLSNPWHHAYPDFDADQKAISDKWDEINKLNRIRHSLGRTRNDGLPLTNVDAWKRVGVDDVILQKDLVRRYDTLVDAIDYEISDLTDELFDLQDAFKTQYKIRFLSPRGLEGSFVQ